MTDKMHDIIQSMYWIVGIVEAMAIIVPWILPEFSHAPFQKQRYYLTPMSTTGAFLILFGTFIRWRCYVALKDLT